MSTPRLPAFAKYRPLRNENGERTGVTVRDTFGVDGWFFDVPGTADSGTRTFAVLHLPGTVTPPGGAGPCAASRETAASTDASA